MVGYRLRPVRRQARTPATNFGRAGALLDILAPLLAVPLTCERFLRALLFSGLQIERVPLDLFDDVFLLHLPLEPSKSAFQSLAVLNGNFRQKLTPPLCNGRTAKWGAR